MLSIELWGSNYHPTHTTDNTYHVVYSHEDGTADILEVFDDIKTALAFCRGYEEGQVEGDRHARAERNADT